MRLLVCGGQHYGDKDAAFTALDKVLTKRAVVLVVHGGANGADTLACLWAEARGIKARTYMPGSLPRDVHGVAAFPGGQGTEDTVMQCIAAGLPVWRPYG